MASEKGVTDFEWVEKFVVELLQNRKIRVTPADILKAIHKKFRTLSKHQIRALIKKLVDQEIVAYTQHYSTTYLEINHTGKFKVTEAISIVPGHFKSSIDTASIAIKLACTASFGAGDHPTTRLCLAALDWLMRKYEKEDQSPPDAALDIGTGTGVLSIAAALLRVNRVVAIDIDPIACYETEKNVEINGLGVHQVEVKNVSLLELKPQKFDLIFANLRPPTLKKLYAEMVLLTNPGGFWIVSGFRPEEFTLLSEQDISKKRKIVWQNKCQNWGAQVINWPSI